ncbi:hypothetical protein [Acidianus ambivalens]|uniref:hypothetical protein n=1 Tax=Acidianus ambivalens TaxID=2283 RepID=UPI0030841E29
MNSEVFLKKLREGSPFFLQIIEEDKIIEKDEEFWKEVIEIYNKVRHLYERKGMDKEDLKLIYL